LILQVVEPEVKDGLLFGVEMDAANNCGYLYWRDFFVRAIVQKKGVSALDETQKITFQQEYSYKVENY